ncbi:MAG: signal peptide peptidase SppA [Candidatus Zixiibacteriota bacterium]|nr:MAG: signal peptide peptidase SppA [candidate division Zixibacteria bacterium]
MFLLIYGALQGEGFAIVGGDRVAIVEVFGTITSPYDVIRQLKKYGEDGSIPSVVLHINSPGGGVAASQEIYEEINKLREKGVKVVASMSAVAASGAYYIACAADTIVANPGTLTGSIGVIFEWPILSELMRKLGVKLEVIKSGDMKDVGSIGRPITRREREMLQSVVDDTYNQFVEVISRERGLPIEDVIELADGRIFTGNQARDLGLVDVIGNFEDAIQIAAEMGGIEGKPKTIKERVRRVSWWELLTERMVDLAGVLEEDKNMPKLEYR